MSKVYNVDEANIKLTPLQKCGYAIGDFGNNFSWSFISAFLMYFWTDSLGIAAGTAGIIIGASRIWDAINDPIVGRWSDHTKSKWGRYRPWILFASLPLAVLNILCFTDFGIESAVGKIAYATATFFILVFVYTCVNVPYSAMEAAVTLDARERGSLATYRLFFAYTASAIISYGTQRFVILFGGGDDSKGYFMTAVMFSVIMVVCHMICFKNTKEVVNTPHEDVSYRESFKCLKGNWPVIILSAGFLIYGLFYYGRSSVALYYFTYNADNALAYSTYSLINLVSSMVGILILGSITSKLKNKAIVPMVGFLVSGILTFVIYFIDPTTTGGMMVVYLTTAVVGLFMGASTTMIYGMVPDTTEYTQLYYGVRASGFISAIVNFFMKVGMAVGVTGAGSVLSAMGYIAGIEQSASVLNGINLIFTVIPGILSIVTAVMLKFYPIDHATYEDILEKLKAQEE
ncbi:MFS transporter [Lachnospiraceae bacterium KGMB03038]|nr:MFS transporter [Lachnospiraceae bacterium KGMB03038]